MQKVIIKNKLNRKERFELTLDEFKARYSAEINTALQSYLKSNKSLLPEFCKKQPTESDFYFSLRFNFNSFSNSPYFIEKFV